MDTFKHLKQFLKEHKLKYITGIIFLIIVDSVQLLIPQIYRNLANDFSNNIISQNAIVKYTVLIIISGFLVSFGRFLWRILILGSSRSLEYFLRDKIFNHILSLPPEYFNTHSTGDLMAHLTNDINAIRMAFGPGIMMIVDSTFMIILTLIMMILTTNIRLTSIAIFTLPIIFIIVNKFGKIIHKRFKKVQDAFSMLTDITQENFSGIRVIKSFVQEDNTLNDFKKINSDNFDANMNLVKVSGSFDPLIQFISSLSFLLLIFFGSKEVIYNNISLGDFVAFNAYLTLLIWPMMALGYVVNIIQRGKASMERINSILDEANTISNPIYPIKLKDYNGKLEFKNVSFKYPSSTRYAIKDISFYIEPGNTLAILGRTGSGKTTIANLILRLYDIESGSILYDDISIKDLSLEDIRYNIAYVAQDNFLFSYSISENIGFSFKDKPSLEKIKSASKKASVYDNIVDFEYGFDTILGERGVTLSGGQKQRISIARALVKNSSLIILDDSLSSVDTETEETILNNLANLDSNSSKIIISHRISTVKNADEIIFLEDGKILERGNHKSLIEQNGQYASLYRSQLLETKIG